VSAEVVTGFFEEREEREERGGGGGGVEKSSLYASVWLVKISKKSVS
jgi:hypothetical protein